MSARTISIDTHALAFALNAGALFAASALVVNFVTGAVFTAYYVPSDATLKESHAVYERILSERATRAADAAKSSALAAAERARQVPLRQRTISERNVEQILPASGSFIGADLSSVTLSLYRDGELAATYPILSKGRPGSFWETPTGLYDVLLKKPSHFSSIGEVYMPYSMQFFGNYFIHGWPFYPDGTQVGVGFSGGCIRLSTDDAKKVYEFAEKGTPLFVYDAVPSSRAALVRVRAEPLPAVTAPSFIVADIESGTVFAERAADVPRPIASITKLMTATVAGEVISFERTLAVAPSSGQTEGDFGSIEKGESFTMRDMLYPLLMESNNASAHAIATTYGTSAFVERMNDKATALGAMQTTFADASGISAQNRSTAADLFTFTRYLARTRSFIFTISRLPQKNVAAADGTVYEFKNNNPFIEHPSFRGGKTGYTTAARETMVSVFEVPAGGATTTLAVIVLGSERRADDTAALLGWFRRAAISAGS